MPKHANEDEAKTAALDALDKGTVTPLTSFFHICSMDNNDGALARTLHYDSMPKHFIWNRSKKCWERRTHLNEALTNIGRIRTVQPTPASMEQFYARMLLYVVKGPTSFANLRTYKEKEHSTYKEACFARGLIEDDNEWTLALEEAAQCQSSAQMRQLFVVILTAGDPVSPLALFDKFWKPMAETWAWKRYHASPHSFPTKGLPPVTDSDKQALLFDLANRLSNFSKPNLSDYGLPLPDESKLDKTISNFKQDDGLRELQEARDFDQPTENANAKAKVAIMNAEQRAAFDVITSARSSAYFFISAGAGTGKTFLANAIVQATHGRGAIALAVASSGIASLLLPKGKTAHSTFKIPLDLHKDSVCNISKRSGLAQLLKEVNLIIWDEVPMTNRFAIEALDRSLQDICDSSSAFGGKVMVFIGDFRQILPVLPRANRAQIFDATMARNSHLWSYFHILHLTENVRVSRLRNSTTQNENEPSVAQLEAYANYLIEVGEARNPADVGVDMIEIPSNFLFPQSSATTSNLIEFVYHDRPLPLPSSPDVELLTDIDTFVFHPTPENKAIANQFIQHDAFAHFKGILTSNDDDSLGQIIFPAGTFHSSSTRSFRDHLLQQHPFKGVIMLGNNSNETEEQREYRMSLLAHQQYYQGKAILTPKNDAVHLINSTVLQSMPGEVHTYLSADSMLDERHDTFNLYPNEFLNSLNTSGLPLHELTLKEGAVAILLRNLDQEHGLCNGTRIIITALHNHIIQGVIITGEFAGQRVMIPRITLQPSDTRFPLTLRRRQFPISLAFAMTINKAQGQSFDRVGLYLPQPVFAHGQLYVAYSRCGYPPTSTHGVRIIAPNILGIQGHFSGEDTKEKYLQKTSFTEKCLILFNSQLQRQLGGESEREEEEK
jgi:hypothetical protein